MLQHDAIWTGKSRHECVWLMSWAWVFHDGISVLTREAGEVGDFPSLVCRKDYFLKSTCKPEREIKMQTIPMVIQNGLQFLQAWHKPLYLWSFLVAAHTECCQLRSSGQRSRRKSQHLKSWEVCLCPVELQMRSQDSQHLDVTLEKSVKWNTLLPAAWYGRKWLTLLVVVVKLQNGDNSWSIKMVIHRRCHSGRQNSILKWQDLGFL